MEKLRQAAEVFSSVFSAGKEILSLHLPNWKIQKLLYSSSTTAVFEVQNLIGKTYVIKMSRVLKSRKKEMDDSFHKVMQLRDWENLLAVLDILWIPLDMHYEIMITLMPFMGTIGTKREPYHDLLYANIVHNTEIYGSSIEQKIHLGIELAQALAVLHKNGLIHHDIKPENLYFKKWKNDITWYLGDFGSVKPLEKQYEGTTSFTASFAAPEILEKKPFSYSSDVYSWGRSMFFIFRDSVPEGIHRTEIEITGKNSVTFRTEKSGKCFYAYPIRGIPFLKIVSKALAINPEDRYASGIELLEALKEIGEVISMEKPVQTEQEYLLQANTVSDDKLPDAPVQKMERMNMERKIKWISGCFEEIELVYDKATKNDSTAKILSELETGALAEARAYSDNIKIDGRSITPQQFDALPDHMKEHVMSTLSTMGLASFSSTISDPKIIVRLTPDIQKVLSCTVFSILNRLEKLDGAFNMLHPTATLELQVPLGGKKGMFQIEYLIMQLYPWLQAREVSSNEVATGMLQSQPQQAPKPQPAPQPATVKKPEQTPAPTKSDSDQPAKPGFFARLFGKKKTAQSTSAEPKKADSGKNMSVEERFYHEMHQKPAFRNAFSCATAEINSVIIKKQFNLKTPAGENLTISAWQQFPETEQLNHILSLGNYSIVPSAVLCVDFVEIIPYCIAITLLYFAYTGQKENQILDTGDGADNTMLKIAVESLNPCYSKWQCKMFGL